MLEILAGAGAALEVMCISMCAGVQIGIHLGMHVGMCARAHMRVHIHVQTCISVQFAKVRAICQKQLI